MNETLKKFITDKFKNTELGFCRIKRNLRIVHYTDSETEKYLKKSFYRQLWKISKQKVKIIISNVLSIM